MKKFVEKDVAENPLYHDTWKLLKKYRDVVWSLEISVQHVRAKFEIEYRTCSPGYDRSSRHKFLYESLLFSLLLCRLAVTLDYEPA